MRAEQPIPEVVSFFSQDRFSKEDLQKLLDLIKEKYNDAELIQQARRQIKEELQYFKIVGYSWNDKINLIPSRLKLIVRKEQHGMEMVDEPGGQQCISPIEQLCKNLKISKSYLAKLLHKPKEEIDTKKELSEEELRSIEPFIKLRTKELNKKIERELRIGKSLNSEKARSSKKSITNKKSKIIKVYEKIKMHGLGKLIYIRSK